MSTMLTHVVLLQPETTTTNEEIHTALDHVRALQFSVPGILAITAGANHSQFHQGFTYGIIMHFVDAAHLEAHHTHPDHEMVVKELERLCQHIIDFDLPEGALPSS